MFDATLMNPPKNPRAGIAFRLLLEPKPAWIYQVKAKNAVTSIALKA